MPNKCEYDQGPEVCYMMRKKNCADCAQYRRVGQQASRVKPDDSDIGIAVAMATGDVGLGFMADAIFGDD